MKPRLMGLQWIRLRRIGLRLMQPRVTQPRSMEALWTD